MRHGRQFRAAVGSVERIPRPAAEALRRYRRAVDGLGEHHPVRTARGRQHLSRDGRGRADARGGARLPPDGYPAPRKTGHGRRVHRRARRPPAGAGTHHRRRHRSGRRAAVERHLIPSWHGRPRRHGRRAGSGRGQRRGAGPHGGGHPQGLRARRGPNHRAACGLRPRGVRRVLRPLVGRGAQRRPDARIRPYAGRQIHDQLAQGGQRHQPRRGGTSPCRAHSGPRSGAAEDPALRLPHPARAGIPPPRHR